MYTPRATACLTAALLLTGHTTAEPIDLRGPGLAEGDHYVLALHAVTDKSPVEMNMGGLDMSGDMAVDYTMTTGFEVLACEDGQPTHVRETIHTYDNTTSMTLMGQDEQHTEDSELVGTVTERRLTEDGWEGEVIEGAPVLDLVAEAWAETGYTAPDALYPSGGVAVGDTWSVEGEALRLFAAIIAVPGAKATGMAEFELAQVVEVDGVPTAVIHYDIDLDITSRQEVEGIKVDLAIELVGGGVIHRRLDTFRDDMRFEGTAAYDMSMYEGGEPQMTMKTELPITSRTRLLTPEEAEAEAEARDAEE